jgi:hypothetical protein
MSDEGPIVREAEAGDAAAIAALQVRSWRTAYRGIVPDAFLDGLAEDAWLERWTDGLAGARRMASIDWSQPPLGADRHVPSRFADPLSGQRLP